MRELLTAMKGILRQNGFIQSDNISGRMKNKYTMTVFTTSNDNQKRGTISGANIGVSREIRIILRFAGTNNKDYEIEILEKQDQIISAFYSYCSGNLVFLSGEITRVGEEWLNEIRFSYNDMITL